MDLDEVKVCLRALLSSTSMSYHLSTLLSDFKATTGSSLPLFGHRNPVELLKSLSDTVQLYGDSQNPEVALIESQKSSHIISLVDRQKQNNRCKSKASYFTSKQRRQILPVNCIENLGTPKKYNSLCSDPTFERKMNGTKNSPLIIPVVGSQNEKFSCNFNYKRETKVAPPEERIILPTPTPLPLRAQSIVAPFLIRNNIVEPHEKVNSVTATNMARAQVVQPPGVCEKTDNWYFDDNASCLSTEHSSNASTAGGYINDTLKEKLKNLIKGHPAGLWCCELPQLFFEKYSFMLDYREYGYTSLIQMLSELPDVFRCIRPGNEDWILFDASVAPSSEEHKINHFLQKEGLLRKVRRNLQRLLWGSCENSSAASVELDKVPELYQEMFGEPLDIKSLGFKDVKSLVEVLEESFSNVFKMNGKLLYGSTKTTENSNSPLRREEALPPITAENDIFIEIFPKEVVGPEESLLELDLTRHIAVGQLVEVCIAEVWSPGKFFIQLNKFRSHLNNFMDELQKFYSVHLNKYKMPDATIRPNQVCVGLYNADPEFPDEWHRAQILKVVNEKFVLINFVDYGTVTRVKKSQLRFLHRYFQSFPVQAFHSHLSGVAPPEGEITWPMTTSKRFLALLKKPYLNAEIVDIDFKKPSLSVVLSDPEQKSKLNINEILVLEKLARVKKVVAEPIILKEDVTCTRNESSSTGKDQTTRPSECSQSALAQVNESLTENGPQITDLFLDIDELSQNEMTNLSLEPCLPPGRISKTPESKGHQNANASFEFEEIPELEKCRHPGGVPLQANKENSSDVVVNIKKFSAKLDQPKPTNENKAEGKKKEKPDTHGSCPSPNAAHEVSPSPFSPAPLRVRKPPGLEHISPQPDLNRLPFLLPQDFLKRQINVLAMELFTNNASIKQVGVNDPALALKIATEMAEAIVCSQLSLTFPVGLGLGPGLFPLRAEESVGGVSGGGVLEGGNEEEGGGEGEGNGTGDEVDGGASITVCPEEETTQDPLTKAKTVEEFVHGIEVGGKRIHVIKIDDELFVCAEEVIRQFTLFSSREVADRVLHIRKINPEYLIISKQSHEKVLHALRSSDLPGVAKRKSKKLKIYLLRLDKVVAFLQALGCRTKPFENDFAELTKNWEGKRTEEAELS